MPGGSLVETEVPVRDRLAPRGGEQRAHGEERTERQSVLQAAAARGNEEAASQRSGQGRKHQGQQNELPAKERADHGQELDVPHAKPFLSAEAIIGFGYRVKKSAADDQANKRTHPPGREKEAADEP